MRRKAKDEKCKGSINPKSVNKNQDESKKGSECFVIGSLSHLVIKSLSDRRIEVANGQKRQRCVIFVDKGNIKNQRRNRNIK